MERLLLGISHRALYLVQRMLGTKGSHSCLNTVKEVKGNVDIITIRSHSSRSSRPRSQCVLPITCTVDCRAYSGVKKEININFIGVQWNTASTASMAAGLYE